MVFGKFPFSVKTKYKVKISTYYYFRIRTRNLSEPDLVFEVLNGRHTITDAMNWRDFEPKV